jgi:shikimate kinase
VGGAPHLILVGIPGAGKSTVGAALAARIGWPFLDLDARIEQRAGMPVSRIFETQGEAAFRALEREATEELARLEQAAVVAPGGGWIAVPGLVDLVRPPSRLIWLRLSTRAALDRLGAGVAARPLLAGPDPLGALTNLLAVREPYYVQADHTVSVEMMTVADVVAEILTLARP